MKKTQPALADVLTLTPMCGKLFVVKRVGERVDVRPVGQVVRPRRRRKVPGVVIPFPARAGL